MGSKTPGRAALKSTMPWGDNDENSGGCGSGKFEATVDIGALMRKRKQTLLVPSSGIGGGGGRLDAMAENPVYSPDDSLARAASKLQSLKALRGGPVAPHRPLGVLPAPKAEVNAAPQTTATLPLSSLNPLRAAQRAAPAAPSEQRLGGEDSGELAALAAVQQRRKSMHAGPGGGGTQDQRYGQFWQGDDGELEDALHEYNRSAPEPAAASPRMTRARRRKSMAADHLVLPDPGSAACLAEEEVEEDVRRAEEEGQPQREREQAQEEQDSGLAAEVAAISAGLCDQLEGCIEDSPEKQPRPDRRSLRDKLLESWGGKSYYARLQEMSQEEESQDKDGQAATGAVQPARQQVLQQALQPAGPQPSGTPAAKAAVSRTAASLASPAPQRGGVQPSRFTPAAKASRPRVQVPATAGSSTAASKAGLPTPNSQRRKLNELTQSLQLLKVTTRHRQALAAEAAAASSAAGRSGPPAVAASKVRGRVSSPLPLQEAAPAAPGAAASRSRRARSTTPEAELQLGGEQAPQAAGSSAQVSPQGVAPRTASRRSARRGGSSSPTEASATASQDKAVGAAAAAAATSTAPSADCPEAMHAELAAARQLLAAVQADNARLAGQLRSAAQEAADERAARVAAEQQAEQLAADLAASAKDRQDLAAALTAAEQRSRQLAKELFEAHQGAGAASAAAADRASEMEARWTEASQALQAVLKAANSGLKAVAAGKEEARTMVEARGGDAAVGTAASARHQRQSGGGRWR
ncbi:hypothetical protein D9Q98_003356 [Chlorella vulgaris]|uniref:Uncharacterized protein n=1 Tax=Chlorella vulgaris TaxID=3077 RepID=A0A9D4YYY2_CHLVU|nr:hypothetical protein D9Q98_003356 [Chlorella vulgaris]